MSDDTFVTVESAARATGISARTLRYWISSSKLTATAEKRGNRVSLADVERLGRLIGKVPGTTTTPTATGPTSAIAMPSVPSSSFDVALVVERIDGLYREQIDAKDKLIQQLEQRIAGLEERQAATAVPALATTEQIDALERRVRELEAQPTKSRLPTPAPRSRPQTPRQTCHGGSSGSGDVVG